MEQSIPFAGNPLDRADHWRRDSAWIDTRIGAPNTRFLPFWQLKPLIRAGDPPALGWLDRKAVGSFLAEGAPLVFLGVDESNNTPAAHFAIDVSVLPDPATGSPFDNHGAFTELRAVAPNLEGGAAGILAQGRTMLDWHARHQFCANCGAPTIADEGGYLRRCMACEANHFPRSDPVVIMMVTHGDMALLARSPRFPPGRYSTLAGYIEPGETIEAAVRREVREEVGVSIGDVRYVASQPWPFPASLMIGCQAVALDIALIPDGKEIEDARWFNRQEIMALLANDDGDILLPGPVAIAHHLIKHWLDERSDV